MNEAETNEVELSTVDEAIEAIRAGKLIIVIDANDRENEGDFICAAELITPEMIATMIREGGGVLCVPLDDETALRLQLNPAVSSHSNNVQFQTNFLVQVDHFESGTGVSTENRARTIRALADPKSRAEDFLKPGHINPLLAKPGGVLRRAGHTEATADLCQLAGLRPIGCLIEIISRNHNKMADIHELKALAQRLNIPIISIAALIRYRRQRERLVHRSVEVKIPTASYGTPTFIAYEVQHDTQEPLAIVWGDLSSTPAPLIRMHSSCFTGDILGSLRCDCGDQFQMSAEMIVREGAGAIIYLPQEGRGIGLTAKLKAYKLQDQGYDTVDANIKLGYQSDSRDYMVGLQILKDLGLSQIRLLTNNPKKTGAFQEWVDIKIVEQIPIIAPPEPLREKYIATKRDRMGHRLPE